MFTILTVCTANTGRSPLAETLLRRHLSDRDRAGTVRVHSAGLMAGGQRVADSVVAEAEARGGSLAEHRSTEVTGEHATEADLILCMTDRHRDRVIDLAPEARDRVFLLGRFVRALGGVGPRRGGEGLPGYLDRVRNHATALDSDPDADQVPDPYGRPPEVLTATADRLQDLTATVVGHLWPGRGE